MDAPNLHTPFVWSAPMRIEGCMVHPLRGRGILIVKCSRSVSFFSRQHHFRYTCRPPGVLPGAIWLGGLGCRMHVQRTCKRFTHQFRLKPPMLRGDRHEVQYLAPSVCWPTIHTLPPTSFRPRGARGAYARYPLNNRFELVD